MADLGTFEFTEKKLIGGITEATSGLMMNYSHMIMGMAAASATLYIIWRGYQTLAGKLSSPMEDVMWDLMRMAIILSFVANINGYLDGIIDAINGLKEGFSGSDNIWQLLDTLWDKAKFLGKTLHDMDESTVVKDEGMTAQFYVWLGVFSLMIVTAFVSMVAELAIILLGITSPIFIFFLMYGFLRPMFNNWLQNIFASILTVLFSSLSLRIVINFMTSVLTQATENAAAVNIVQLGAQVFLAGICAAMLIWFSAKLAGALAGAGATASMQGLAAIGLGAAFFGAGKLASGAGKDTTRTIQDNIQGWKAVETGKSGPPGGGAGYNAARARKYAIEQIIVRNEARRLAQERADAVQKHNAPPSGHSTI
ncbi:type IV secretion system protein [Enterobacter ludwigii]|nr:type IV secretion system protein [Enterobacter ludwigii]